VLTTFEKEEILEYPNVYFIGQLAKKIHAGEGKGPNFGYDDDKGRYKTVKNDHVAYRFEVLKGLGRGSFGDVVKAFDHSAKGDVALKIIRNERRFHKQAQTEIKILDLLRKQDKRGTHHLIHLKDYFLFRGHLCLTFDLLGPDLYSALKKDNFKGFPVAKVQSFTADLLACLRVLRRSHIIHCDLKPENILLTGTGDSITVIDFGSSCFDHQRVHSYIQSRFYRSPEVILGCAYNTAIDMWSLGCILAELYTGHPIFPGRDEKEQLLYQCEVLGLPPAELLAEAKRTSVFFDEDGNLRQLVDRKGRKRLPGTRPLAKALGTTNEAFIDFIERCFAWDPAVRMTPRDASKHPFVAGGNIDLADLASSLPYAFSGSELPAADAAAAAADDDEDTASQATTATASAPAAPAAKPPAATKSTMPVPVKKSAFTNLVTLLSPKQRKKKIVDTSNGDVV
jgi:dual specificity tyrosine-phosphorylation-regulated kinase 2/3/4